MIDESKTGLQSLKPEDREKGMQELDMWSKGAKPDPSFATAMGMDFNGMTDLKARAELADGVARISGNSPSARADANYANALFRDSRYTYGGRKYQMAIAMQAKLSGLYQGAKVHIDLNGGS